MELQIGNISNPGQGIGTADIITYLKIVSGQIPLVTLSKTQFDLLNTKNESPFTGAFDLGNIVILKKMLSGILPPIYIDYISPFDLSNAERGTQVAASGDHYIATEPYATGTGYWGETLGNTIRTIGHCTVYQKIGDDLDEYSTIESPWEILKMRDFLPNSLEFGLRSADISDTHAVVTALYSNNTGVAFVYNRVNSQFQLNHEITIPVCTNAPIAKLNTNYVFVANSTEGTVRIYELNSLPMADISAPIDIIPEQILESTTIESLGFGSDISVSGDTLAIGHENGDVQTGSSVATTGYTDIYEKSGDVWQKTKQFTPQDFDAVSQSSAQLMNINHVDFCVSESDTTSINGDWSVAPNEEISGKPVWTNGTWFMRWMPTCTPLATITGLPSIVYPSTRFELNIGGDCVVEYKWKLSSVPSLKTICVKFQGDQTAAGTGKYIKDGAYWNGQLEFGRQLYRHQGTWRIGWASDPGTGDLVTSDPWPFANPAGATWPAGWEITLEACDAKSILDWSDPVSADINLELPGLDHGYWLETDDNPHYTLYVIGMTPDGEWQPLEFPTTIEWNVIPDVAHIQVASAWTTNDDGDEEVLTVSSEPQLETIFSVKKKLFWDQHLKLNIGGPDVQKYAYKRSWVEGEAWQPSTAGTDIAIPLVLDHDAAEDNWLPGIKLVRLAGINSNGTLDTDNQITVMFDIKERIDTESFCSPFYAVAAAPNDNQCIPSFSADTGSPFYDPSHTYSPGNKVTWWTNDTDNKLGTWRATHTSFNHDPRESLPGGSDCIDNGQGGCIPPIQWQDKDDKGNPRIYQPPWILQCECDCTVIDGETYLDCNDPDDITIQSSGDTIESNAVAHDNAALMGMWIIVPTIDSIEIKIQSTEKPDGTGPYHADIWPFDLEIGACVEKTTLPTSSFCVASDAADEPAWVGTYVHNDQNYLGNPLYQQKLGAWVCWFNDPVDESAYWVISENEGQIAGNITGDIEGNEKFQQPWQVPWSDMWGGNTISVTQGNCDDDVSCAEGFHPEWQDETSGELCSPGENGCIEVCVPDPTPTHGYGTDITVSFGSCVTVEGDYTLVGSPRSYNTSPDRREGSVFVYKDGDCIAKLDHDDSLTDSESIEGSFEFGRSVTMLGDDIWVVEKIPGKGTYVVPFEHADSEWSATSAFLVTEDAVDGNLASGDTGVVFGAGEEHGYGPGHFQGFSDSSGKIEEECAEGYTKECNTDVAPTDYPECDLCSDVVSAHKDALTHLKSDNAKIMIDDTTGALIHDLATDLANSCELSEWQKDTLTDMINHAIASGFDFGDDFQDFASTHPDFTALVIQLALKGGDALIKFFEDFEGMYDSIELEMTTTKMIERCANKHNGVCPPEKIAEIEALDKDGDGVADLCPFDGMSEQDWQELISQMQEWKSQLTELKNQNESVGLKKLLIKTSFSSKQIKEMQAAWEGVRAEWIESGEGWVQVKGWFGNLYTPKVPPENMVTATANLIDWSIVRIDKVIEIFSNVSADYKEFRNKTCDAETYYDPATEKPVYFLDGEPDCDCVPEVGSHGSPMQTNGVDLTLPMFGGDLKYVRVVRGGKIIPMKEILQ